MAAKREVDQVITWTHPLFSYVGEMPREKVIALKKIVKEMKVQASKMARREKQGRCFCLSKMIF